MTIVVIVLSIALLIGLAVLVVQANRSQSIPWYQSATDIPRPDRNPTSARARELAGSSHVTDRDRDRIDTELRAMRDARGTSTSPALDGTR